MNTKTCDNHNEFDVLSNEAEECMSSKATFDSEEQNLEASCRKRPPGGISMYSFSGASDCNIIISSSSSTSSHNKDSFMMNGNKPNNRCGKLNNTNTNMSIGQNKRKLKDGAISAKQIGKPLERSEEIVPEPKKLLTFHQIPTHLRFNRFVLSHYRAPTNWKGCIRSLAYMHNETINILTHGKTTSSSSYLNFIHYPDHA